MKRNVPSPALGRELSRRKLSDLLALIPIFGALIFVTPILDNFPKLLTIASIPLPVFLIFGSWLGGIVIVATTNHIMRRLENEQVAALQERVDSLDAKHDDYTDG